MSPSKRSYGVWSRTMLDELRARGLLKVEAFVACLAEHGVHVDRTLVSHWAGGRAHLPADLLPWLARFTGAPARVFAPYLRDLDCEIVHIPRGPLPDREIVDLLLEAAATLGRLQRGLLEARSPNSPGGTEITDTERVQLGVRVDELIHQLAELRRRLRGLDCHGE